VDDARLSELARKVQGGDRTCFRFLVEAETRRLIAMAYRYTRDWETARDLSQDTWLKVHRQLPSYDPQRSFRAWLTAIHRNHCLTHVKTSAGREQSTSNEELLHLSPAVEGGDPLEHLQRRELAARLGAAMARLSERQLRVFAFVELEQVSREEASRALGMKPATLRATLHFARRRLARWIRRMENRSCVKT
jgi:RNA polymerase sigma-70 factor (ECF subfamily)